MKPVIAQILRLLWEVYTLAKVKITTSNRKETYPLKKQTYDKKAKKSGPGEHTQHVEFTSYSIRPKSLVLRQFSNPIFLDLNIFLVINIQ